jgi:hypothetical protein
MGLDSTSFHDVPLFRKRAERQPFQFQRLEEQVIGKFSSFLVSYFFQTYEK